MPDEEYSVEPVMVPSPFGEWKDGVKISSLGNPMVETHFPNIVDPVTGYTMELNMYEQLGMIIDSDPLMGALFDVVHRNLLEAVAEHATRIAVQFVREVDEAKAGASE